MGKRGRVSSQELIEKQLGIPIAEIFNKNFKKIKTIEEACAKFNAVSKKKLTIGHQTLLKYISQCVQQGTINAEDFPFAKIEKSEGKRRGRVSVKDQIESILKMPMDQIFNKHFKGIQTLDEVVKKYTEISNLQAGSVTIMKYFLEYANQGKLAIQDFPFAKMEKKEKGAHMKERGFRFKIEKALEEMNKTVSFFEALDEFKDHDVDLAARMIEQKYSVTCNKVMLVNTLRSAFQNNEIQATRYPHWFRPRKRGRAKLNIGEQAVASAAKGHSITVLERCQCGNSKRAYPINDVDSPAPHFSLALIAHKCPSCNKWGEGIAQLKIGDKIYTKKVVEGIEQFIDQNDKVIFPFTESQSESKPVLQ